MSVYEDIKTLLGVVDTVKELKSEVSDLKKEVSALKEKIAYLEGRETAIVLSAKEATREVIAQRSSWVPEHINNDGND